MTEPTFQPRDKVRLIIPNDSRKYRYGVIVKELPVTAEGRRYQVIENDSGKVGDWNATSLKPIHIKVSLLDAFHITVAMASGEVRKFIVSAFNYPHAAVKAARHARKQNWCVKQINIEL